MTDNKTCSVDILSVSLGEEGYLIIPRQTRELCEPLVKAAENALGREGMTPVLTCFPAWSDAGFMNALTKSECIVLGPGDLSVAHSIHEKISKRQLLSAVSVYEEMAREICKTVWT